MLDVGHFYPELLSVGYAAAYPNRYDAIRVQIAYWPLAVGARVFLSWVSRGPMRSLPGVECLSINEGISPGFLGGPTWLVILPLI